MADPKKNPLIGAFRAPAPGSTPVTSAEGESKTVPPVQDTAPKAAEPPKDTAPKGKAEGAAPAGPTEGKKPEEPPKATDPKSKAEGVAPAGPTEGKKPEEPPKMIERQAAKAKAEKDAKKKPSSIER